MGKELKKGDWLVSIDSVVESDEMETGEMLVCYRRWKMRMFGDAGTLVAVECRLLAPCLGTWRCGSDVEWRRKGNSWLRM